MRIVVGFIIAALATCAVGQTTAPSTRPALTLVTLQSKGGLPQAALRRLAEQSGVVIRVVPEDYWRNAEVRTITLDVKDRPFWEVLLQVCEQAKLTPGYDGQRDGIVLAESGPPTTLKQPHCYHDGVLFIAESVTRSHGVTYGRKARSDSFNLQMQVFADPKLRILQGPQSARVTEASDDTGHSLALNLPADAEYQLAESTEGQFSRWSINAALQFRPDQGKVLKRLAGAVQFLLVDREETWDVDLTKFEKASRESPHASYTIDSFDTTDDQYTLKVTIQLKSKPRDDGEEDPMTSGDAVTSMMRIVDAKGKPLFCDLSEDNQDGQKKTMTLNFNRMQGDRKPGKAAKLLWTIPISTKKLDVPFEMTDLPIP